MTSLFEKFVWRYFKTKPENGLFRQMYEGEWPKIAEPVHPLAEEAWVGVDAGKDDSGVVIGTRTGRLSGFRPPLMMFDYASIEADLITAMARQFDQKQLDAYLNGDHSIPVKVFLIQDGVQIRHGLAFIDVKSSGNDFRTLRDLGYEVRIRHKRVYADYPSGEPVLLSRREAYYRLPSKEAVAFHESNNGIRVQEGADWQEPLEFGGETTVRLSAPGGHWTEGVARCNLIDRFDKKVGRGLALARAITALNDLVAVRYSANPVGFIYDVRYGGKNPAAEVDLSNPLYPGRGEPARA